MKIGNLLLIITGILTIVSGIKLFQLVINYMECTSLFRNLVITCTSSAISCISLFAIKNEN